MRTATGRSILKAWPSTASLARNTHWYDTIGGRTNVQETASIIARRCRGRCHDVRILFVVDGSIFVTASEVNPTSTIQALALYIGDSIRHNITNL